MHLHSETKVDTIEFAMGNIYPLKISLDTPNHTRSSGRFSLLQVNCFKNHLFLFLVLFCLPALAHLALRWADEKKPSLSALAMQPAISLFSKDEFLNKEKLEKLLFSPELDVKSDKNAFVPEKELNAAVPAPLDWTQVGYGRSSFVVSGKWSTIRYLGPGAAGAGLPKKEMEDAQRQKFGTSTDSIPVLTAAWTIERMMTDFYAPLLSKLPNGKRALSRIHVQGAYYSPLSFESEAETPQFDNAFIVGLQSLRLFPHSCFDTKSIPSNNCSGPQLSAGHDPSIVAHELTHVIFNHLRDERSFFGFQWFAVNEGYADFFSAVYLKDPFIGRIWKSNLKTAPYLRQLVDHPEVNSEEASNEIHSYSVFWSSFLWTVRQSLMKEMSADESDINRVILMSISFLGETDKTKLGDAASALLKASESLGFPSWKKLILREALKSKFDVQASALASEQPYAENSVTDRKTGACGSLTRPQNTAHKSTWSLTALILLLPLSLELLQFVRRFFNQKTATVLKRRRKNE
jgi:hypothetical protein